MNLTTLKACAKAIKELDSVSFSKTGNKEELDNLSEARKILINIIFDNGYELRHENYRLIKSKFKRQLI